MENRSCRAGKGGRCFPVSARNTGVAASCEDVERRTTAPLLGKGIKDCNSIDGKSITSTSLPIQNRFSAAPSLWGSGRSKASRNPLLVQCRRRAKISVEARLGDGCTKYQEDKFQMNVGRPKECLVTLEKTYVFSDISLRKRKDIDVRNQCKVLGIRS